MAYILTFSAMDYHGNTFHHLVMPKDPLFRIERGASLVNGFYKRSFLQEIGSDPLDIT